MWAPCADTRRKPDAPRSPAKMVQFDGEIIKPFSSRSLREEKEVSLLVGAEKICSRLEFRRKHGIFVATGPGPCQIEMTMALTSSYEGSNSGYAIKPKKPVKRQADTETRKFRFNVI